MNVLAKLFMRMWILRANPQDLPASQVLTYGLAFVYVVISTLSVISRISLPAAFAASMLDLGLLVLTVHALLAIAKVPERGMQTLSAIFGASIVLVIVSTAMMAIADTPSVRGTMLLMLLAWYLLIFGHVLRQAISMPVLLGALIGLLYLMLSAALTSTLFFPGPGEGGAGS